MVGKAFSVAILFFITVCLYTCASAEDYEARLRDIRYKKASEEMTYKKELAEINQKANAELDVIKADFHAKRDGRLARLKEDQKNLKKDYDTRIAPLVEEEKKLVETLGTAGSNFVKIKERK